MKAYGIFSALLVTLTSLTALAVKPLPLSGEYKYAGVIVNGTTDFRIVYTFTDAGKVELKELINQGYICEPKPRETSLCKKFVDRSADADEVMARATAKFQDYSIAFLNHAPEAPDTPENESPHLKEWRIMQKVRIGETYYPSYRYQIIQDVTHKIALGESGDTTAPYFVVRSENQVGIVMEMSKKNPKGYQTFRVEVILSTSADPKP